MLDVLQRFTDLVSREASHDPGLPWHSVVFAIHRGERVKKLLALACFALFAVRFVKIQVNSTL